MSTVPLIRPVESRPMGRSQMLTVQPSLPNFRSAVAPVTCSLGGLTRKRLHWSGVVRRGAVDITPDHTDEHLTTSRTEHLPRNQA
jgi:hypothetical protein